MIVRTLTLIIVNSDIGLFPLRGVFSIITQVQNHTVLAVTARKNNIM